MADAEKLLEAARAAAREGEIGEAKRLYNTIIGNSIGTPYAEAARQELGALGKPAKESQSTKNDGDAESTIQAVRVVDLDIKLWTLIWLMVKFAIAVIPAAAILYILTIAILGALGLSLRGL